MAAMTRTQKMIAAFTLAALGIGAAGSYIALQKYQGTGVNKAPLQAVFFESATSPVSLLKLPRQLDSAVRARDMDAVMDLLKQGADPNLTTHFSGPALTEAADWVADVEMMKLLVRYGADVNQSNNAGTTPLHKVITNASLNNNKAEEAFRYLLSAGANPDAPRNELGYTPREWLDHFQKDNLKKILDEHDRNGRFLRQGHRDLLL